MKPKNLSEVRLLDVRMLLMNVHVIADPLNDFKLTEQTRPVGLVVCRGTAVIHISPVDGSEEIENPFLAAQE